MILSSKNVKVLCLSDWHQDSKKLNKVLSYESADIVLDLGDEYDSYNYNTKNALIETIQLREEMLSKKNYYCLLGNHSVSYLYPSIYTTCSGWESWKQNLINENFNKELRKNYKWYIIIDNYLCTHAGLNKHHLPLNAEINLGWIDNWLQKESEQANICLGTKQKHWFYNVGLSRGGRDIVGGILWNDFNLEHIPIQGLMQVMGHTSGTKVRSFNSVYRNDICIDSQLNEWLTITDGKVEIKRFKGL